MHRLGPSPSLADTADAIEYLVDLFQKLKQPPNNSIVGLVGELVFILAARDPSIAVQAWHTDPMEVYDFADYDLRLDVKSTSGMERRHHLTYEQANPPEGTVGILASLFINSMAGGTTLSQLLGLIERRLPDPIAVGKLRLVVASSLGELLPHCLDWAFDLARASGSIAIFDLCTIPAVRGPLGDRISAVRFTSDLTGCERASATLLDRLSARAISLLPGRS